MTVTKNRRLCWDLTISRTRRLASHVVSFKSNVQLAHIEATGRFMVLYNQLIWNFHPQEAVVDTARSRQLCRPYPGSVSWSLCV